MNNGWKYYNHALIPTTLPHEKVDILALNDKYLWKGQGGGSKPLLARYTTEFDCKRKTAWWYCIKDTIFEKDKLKAKLRYEINKGCKNFYTKIIKPEAYLQQLTEVHLEAAKAYPLKYRKEVDVGWLQSTALVSAPGKIYYAAFHRENDRICAYMVMKVMVDCDSARKVFYMDVEKSIPAYEHLNVNFALVNGMLEDLNKELVKGAYICDGERNISHETHFQEWLIKYFGFRYAYCNLEIVYRPIMKMAVDIIFPFRKIVMRYDKNSFTHKICAILKQEECRRNCRNFTQQKEDE